MATETSTGFRQIYYSRKLQDYWIRRLIAIIIDSIIMSIAAWIIMALIMLAYLMSINEPFAMPWWTMHGLTFPFLSGMPLFLYSALTEYFYGYTFGKRIMGLKVVTAEGKKPAIGMAFLRNATKIYGLALLLDVVVALALPGDPTKKYTDRFAVATVVTMSS